MSKRVTSFEADFAPRNQGSSLFVEVRIFRKRREHDFHILQALLAGGHLWGSHLSGCGIPNLQTVRRLLLGPLDSSPWKTRPTKMRNAWAHFHSKVKPTVNSNMHFWNAANLSQNPRESHAPRPRGHGHPSGPAALPAAGANVG